MAVAAFAGFMCLAVLLMIFAAPFMDYAYKRAFDLPNLLLAVLGVVAVAATLAAVVSPAGASLRRALSRQGSRFDRVVAVATVALFAALVPFVRSYALETGWDSGAVTSIAWDIATSGAPRDVAWANSYFSMYPNNLFLLWMVTEVFQLAALFGAASQIEAIEVFVVLNCLSWAIATWCAYKALREISSPLCALAGWGVCVLLLWTSPWTGIVYTDSLALAVPSATVYLYLRSLRAGVAGRCGLWAALGVVSIVGYRLKPQTVFPLFAIVTLELVRTVVIARRAACGRLRRPRAALGIRAISYAGLGAGPPLPSHSRPRRPAAFRSRAMRAANSAPSTSS